MKKGTETMKSQIKEPNNNYGIQLSELKPEEKIEAGKVIKKITEAIPNGQHLRVFISLAFPDAAYVRDQYVYRYGKRKMLYHIAGTELYRRFNQTGKIDEPWWEVFVEAVRRRGDAAARTHDEPFRPFNELEFRIAKAKTFEQRVEILRSIVPKSKKTKTQGV